MKNLKKVLSLALAFAMVLGLCVTGMAAQDVTTLADWDTVTDKDSAILLNAFSIMSGDADGNFYPENNVTRAEAAAMISRALWGGVDNVALYAAGNVGSYVDVIPGYWYMGYVNYLTVTGVMTGKLEGKFDPDGNVTGYELLKMALVALGYDAEKEGLTGLGWDIKTMAIATSGPNNLTAGTTVTDWSAPLSRMNAATIIANMVWRETVSYSLITGALVPSGVAFGVEVLGMTVDTGVLVGNQYGTVANLGTSNTPNTEKGENAEVYVTAGDTNIVTTIETEITDLGAPVLLYYANGKLVSATVDNTLVEQVKVNNVVTNDESNNAAQTFGNGTLDYTDTYYVDFDGNGKYNQTVTLNYETIAKVADVVETETFGTIYVLGNAKWDTKNDVKTYTPVAANGFIVAANSNIVAAKGDYVAYDESTNVFNKEYVYGHVLTAVEGEVTRDVTNVNGTHTYHVDGAPYTASADATGISFGVEGTFYLYPNSKIAKYVEPTGAAPAATTYAVLYGAGYEAYGSTTGLASTSGVIVEVEAILETGEKGIYEVNSVYNISNDGATYLVSKLNATTIEGTGNNQMTAEDGTTKKDGLFATNGVLTAVKTTPTLVAYTLTDEGKINIKLLNTDANDPTTTIATTITAGSANIGGGNYLVSGTVSFVQTDDTAGKQVWSVVKGTGVSLATGKNLDGIVKDYLGNTKQISYLVALKGDLAVATTTSDFYYVLANGGQIGKDDNDQAIYEITVYNASTGKVEVLESTGTNITAGLFYNTYSGGALGTTGTISTTKGWVTGVEAEIIELTTDVDENNENPRKTALTVNGDTKYHYIDGENSTAIDAADLTVQTTVKDTIDPNTQARTDYYQAIVINGQNAVEHVIVFKSVQK